MENVLHSVYKEKGFTLFLVYNSTILCERIVTSTGQKSNLNNDAKIQQAQFSAHFSKIFVDRKCEKITNQQPVSITFVTEAKREY